ncbi:MAG TPA: pilin [Candidatus Pacearchaeota archaeon]|nr:pilin [Candidatus Pacearchaeota archaeon]HOK94016.1 pilin [Candidatus Pacearchaeota archaeon]HPO75087.1 pilin [Candidatus Pacearchaeota archaeon]
MKKIFLIIIILALVSLTLVPIIVSAQATPKECCMIKRTYPDFACGTYSYTVPGLGHGTLGPEPVVGDIVGPEGGYCDLEGDGTQEDITCETKDWGTICLMETVYNITDWIFYIVLSIAVIFGIVAGFQFMTSSGDPGKTEKARNLLLYMAIGLAVAALAKVIPAIVRTMVGF